MAMPLLGSVASDPAEAMAPPSMGRFPSITA
jgi:hypothetical protein